ncbi:Uncharacterized protein PBTT_06144 [Plasmodiophora brassicae]
MSRGTPLLCIVCFAMMVHGQQAAGQGIPATAAGSSPPPLAPSAGSGPGDVVPPPAQSVNTPSTGPNAPEAYRLVSSPAPGRPATSQPSDVLVIRNLSLPNDARNRYRIRLRDASTMQILTPDIAYPAIAFVSGNLK